MKFVREFRRAASGHAEAVEGGQTFYFPANLSGSTISVEITATKPRPGHFASGYLVRGRSGYAELTANGQTFFFPMKNAGQFAAVDIISPVTQQTTPDTPASGGSPLGNFIAQARASRSAASTVPGGPTPDQLAQRGVNATTGRIRVHDDEDLEVLG